MHRHASRCRKPPHGVESCAQGMPQALSPATTFEQVEWAPQAQPRQEPQEEEEEQQPLVRAAGAISSPPSIFPAAEHNAPSEQRQAERLLAETCPALPWGIRHAAQSAASRFALFNRAELVEQVRAAAAQGT